MARIIPATGVRLEKMGNKKAGKTRLFLRQQVPDLL
jgi:hypothetical protein